jgi:hypothetical protein
MGLPTTTVSGTGYGTGVPHRVAAQVAFEKAKLVKPAWFFHFMLSQGLTPGAFGRYGSADFDLYAAPPPPPEQRDRHAQVLHHPLAKPHERVRRVEHVRLSERVHGYETGAVLDGELHESLAAAVQVEFEGKNFETGFSLHRLKGCL